MVFLSFFHGFASIFHGVHQFVHLFSSVFYPVHLFFRGCASIFRGLPRFCNVFLQFSMAFIDFPLFGSVSMFSMVYPWCCSCHLAGASARSLGRHLAGSSIVSRVPPGAILLLWYIYIYFFFDIYIYIYTCLYIYTHTIAPAHPISDTPVRNSGRLWYITYITYKTCITYWLVSPCKVRPCGLLCWRALSCEWWPWTPFLGTSPWRPWPRRRRFGVGVLLALRPKCWAGGFIHFVCSIFPKLIATKWRDMGFGPGPLVWYFIGSSVVILAAWDGSLVILAAWDDP